MDKEILKGLGMTGNEVDVYLALLESSGLSANAVAKKSSLHRQVCYDALNRLIEKGFASYVVQGDKKVFNAMNPRKILDYLEEKKEHVKSILPELIALAKENTDDTVVEVLKGRNVVRTVYKDIFRVMKERKTSMYAMGVDEQEFLKADEIAIRQYIKKIRKHKLKEKLLSKESASFFFEGPQSEYRLLPDEMFNPNPTHIYGDKVCIIVWGKPMHGIVIKNREIADANRKYFMMLWKMAKERVT